MTNSEHAPGYVLNPDYLQEDWDEVSDTPELTEAELAELRPHGEGLPVPLADAFKHLAGRPKSKAKADGPSWQTWMNEALAAGLRGRR